ncbi:hypothetical protein ACWDYD_34700, partial [Nocardia sp. NPDC003054]
MNDSPSGHRRGRPPPDRRGPRCPPRRARRRRCGPRPRVPSPNWAPAGLWFANVGHGRAEIADAVAEQLRTIAHYSN